MSAQTQQDTFMVRLQDALGIRDGWPTDDLAHAEERILSEVRVLREDLAKDEENTCAPKHDPTLPKDVFMGRPVPYWLELDARAQMNRHEGLIEEIAQLKLQVQAVAAGKRLEFRRCPQCGGETPSMQSNASEAIRERLADYAHEAWAGWMRHLEKKAVKVDYSGKRFGMQWMREDRARWVRQMDTPYVMLPEEEKASDRAQADRILAILRGEGK